MYIDYTWIFKWILLHQWNLICCFLLSPACSVCTHITVSLLAYCIAGYFPSFKFLESAHNSAKIVLGYCIKFDCGSLLWHWWNMTSVSYSLLDPMQGFIKQQHLCLHLHAVANTEVITTTYLLWMVLAAKLKSGDKEVSSYKATCTPKFQCKSSKLVILCYMQSLIVIG